jgi:putative DNA primase/helicase
MTVHRGSTSPGRARCRRFATLRQRVHLLINWGLRMLEPVEQFRAALAGRGILPKDGEVIADGRIHRCDAEGRGGKGDAAYLLHLDGIPAGGFENWRDGFGWQNWRAEPARTLSPAEEAAHRAKLKKAQRERELEEGKRHANARKLANSVLESAALCDFHPYTARKGIRAHGARVQGDRLVIPLRDVEGAIHSLQFIGADGEKRFLTGGRKAGCYFEIGRPVDVLCVAEGFATGASIHEATGYAVAVAFDAGNLGSVAKALREKHPDLQLIVCADDDHQTAGNPGLSKATEAALSTGALLAVPDFRHGATRKGHRLQRPAPVRRPGRSAALHRKRSQDPANLTTTRHRPMKAKNSAVQCPAMAKPQRPRLRPMRGLNASSAAAASG